ncbi:MAG: glycosyltransferase family 4 protein [Anaerolineales bacterium]|nr:glycosyltransferase family 4 protein [Anaerolineales bacterium]
MSLANPVRICLTPRVSGVGGMVSFQHKLADGLQKRGVQVGYDLQDGPYQAVLVIGGTRRLAGLRRLRQRGIPVVQRLDGMNWLHRMHSSGLQSSGLRHFLRAEYGNLILTLVRNRLASLVVYQSRFVQGWWERKHGPTRVPSRVIYNGVDLGVYTPLGPESPPADRLRLLMVEGSLMGGYEQGLQVAVELVAQLAQTWSQQAGKPVELMVVGRVPPELQRQYENRLAASLAGKTQLNWVGLVERERIPAIDRSAHLLYSSDINAACPNSVIESLACGLPVAAFDTGALPELVTGDSGRIAPYGGDPWKLEHPDVAALAAAAGEILDEPERFRRAARQRAEQAFSLEAMVDAYLDALLGQVR